jgi:hypothetical protein
MDRDDLWRLSMSLAEAWAGVMEPGSEGSIDFGARRASMESYASAGVSAEPMLDGAVLMEMLPELDPRSGFIREAQRRLVDRQLAGEIADEAGARAFVERIGDSLRARYGAGGRG